MLLRHILTFTRAVMMIFKNKGLTFKLAFSILASTTIIFYLIFWYNYRISYRLISRKIEANAFQVTNVAVNKIETVLKAVEKIPENMAYILENTPYGNEEEVRRLLYALVKNNSEIYGSTIAFEPYAFRNDTRDFGVYCYKNKDSVDFMLMAEEGYRYKEWDWYQIPEMLQHAIWTEPYFDEGAGNIIMVTYSVPFYKTVNGKRVFMGIVTADIELSWLEELISHIKIGKTGYGFLISRNGVVVTHPDKRLIMNKTIFGIAEERKDLALRKAGRDMVRGHTGFVPYTSLLTGKECRMVYASLPSSGWSIGVLFPMDELMNDVRNLNITVFVLGTAGFIILLIVIFFIARSIIRPLYALAQVTKKVAEGDLDFELAPAVSNDEVGVLTSSFVSMRKALKQYIKDLTATTAAKERIESELNIARDIQMSIIPNTFPAFPERTEFDLYAKIITAKAVGGDLYDFFFIDERRLCFIVGDVSGKGVPAALFMAVTRTLLRSKAIEGISAASLITEVNNCLCLENEACMFCTLFLAIMDIKTGVCEFTNAGHNRPYLVLEKERIEPLAKVHGAPLGVMDNKTYHSDTITLKKGEAIVIYTDGVTEAQTVTHEMFEEDRLEAVVRANMTVSPQVLTDKIVGAVKDFEGEADQADDITVLVLRYLGV